MGKGHRGDIVHLTEGLHQGVRPPRPPMRNLRLDMWEGRRRTIPCVVSMIDDKGTDSRDERGWTPTIPP
jgi:hypothetical protein